MKKLVIIGGGFAGARIANKLQKEFDITLIDTKEYFEYTPGILRALVKPDHTKKLQVPHKQYLKRGTFVQGAVHNVTRKQVHLDQQTILYDYLVIASGSQYALPFKQKNVLLPQRAQTLVQHHKELTKVKKLLIVGGGIVGVELAAEIKYYYPKKHVVILHSREELTPRCQDKTTKYVTQHLKKNGVELILGERLKNANNNTFTTNKGTTIRADYAFMSIGITPNTAFLEGFAALDEKGFVKTKQTLLMQDSNNIFVAGDVVDIKEEKLAQNAEKHANIIIHNLRQLQQNKPLKPYNTIQHPLLISLGPYDGSFCYKKAHITGFLAGLLKTMVEKLTLVQYKK